MNNLLLVGMLLVVGVVAGLIAAIIPYAQPVTVRNVDVMVGNGQFEIITQENLEYFAEAKGYFARPKEAGNYPGVVMIHENRGLRPEIKQAADALAKEGYMVLAVDLFNSATAEDQTGARELTSKFNQETGIANMRKAAEYLRLQGATKMASLGWCFGGRQSVELAISGEKLDATVVYYGGNMATTTDKLAPITWPVLGVFGDQDQAIPVAKVEEFENSLNALEIENEIYIYSGVGHAFANPSGANYAPEETMDAWQKTLHFLDKHLQSNESIQPIVIPGTGIRGVVMLGPTCPVMRVPPEPGCDDKPYKTRLALTTKDGSRVLSEFESDTEGKFSIVIAPGEYAIRSAAAANVLPYCSSEVVTVIGGQYADVAVSCDSGIR